MHEALFSNILTSVLYKMVVLRSGGKMLWKVSQHIMNSDNCDFKKKKKRARVAFLKTYNPRSSFDNNINLISLLMILKIQSKFNVGFKTQVLSPSPPL